MGGGNGGRVPSEDRSAIVGRAGRRFQRVDATPILDPKFLELYLGNGSGGDSGSLVVLQDGDPFEMNWNQSQTDQTFASVAHTFSEPLRARGGPEYITPHT